MDGFRLSSRTFRDHSITTNQRRWASHIAHCRPRILRAKFATHSRNTAPLLYLSSQCKPGALVKIPAIHPVATFQVLTPKCDVALSVWTLRKRRDDAIHTSATATGYSSISMSLPCRRTE